MSEFIIAAVFLLIGGSGVSYMYSSVLHQAAGAGTDPRRLPSQYLGFERRDFRRMDRRLLESHHSDRAERRQSAGRRITDPSH